LLRRCLEALFGEIHVRATVSGAMTVALQAILITSDAGSVSPQRQIALPSPGTRPLATQVRCPSVGRPLQIASPADSTASRFANSGISDNQNQSTMTCTAPP